MGRLRAVLSRAPGAAYAAAPGAVVSAPPQPRPAPCASEADGHRPLMPLVWLALLTIVGAGLAIRVVNNAYGLPFVYYYDEANHFTNYAVQMVSSGNLDPAYYQNPSAFTYLVLFVLHLVYGVFGVHLAHGSVVHQYAVDPTPIYQLSRTLTAVLAMAGVVATFLVARRFWGAAVGLVAAAVLTFAFLPVTYSRIAVTDVGTFVPVAVALYAALRVHESGRLVHYALGGAAVGVACGFKYTAGLAIVPLVVAAALRFWDGRGSGAPLRRSPQLRGLVLAGVLLVACFAITTPYFFVHLHVAAYQLKSQAQAAGGSEKLGQSQQGGFSYYLSSLTWGLGWAAAAFALVGAVLEARRDRRRAAMLVVFPLVLYLYMGTQSRYFGRWLLSIYPLLAILAGIGIVRAVQLASRARVPRLAQVLAGALLTAAALVQPVAADVRTAQVLGRTDTRELARDYLVAHFPRSLRAVIEPAVPLAYYGLAGTPHANRVHQFVRGFVKDIRRGAAADAPLGADTSYAATLRPSNVDAYRRAGFCIVVTMSLIRGRVDFPAHPNEYAYYGRLVRESTLLYTVSPFKPGRRPVPLHFDFSYDYYPTAYERPGAVVDVYRLNGCREQYGAVPTRPFGMTGLDKGLKSSFVPNS